MKAKTVANVAALTALTAFALCGFARNFVMLSPEGLRQLSDLIIVGTVTEVRDLHETNGGLRGVLTTFRIDQGIQGPPDPAYRVQMHHYRFAQSNQSAFNGPDLVTFVPSKTNRYELLLKKDGFWYAPVSCIWHWAGPPMARATCWGCGLSRPKGRSSG